MFQMISVTFVAIGQMMFVSPRRGVETMLDFHRDLDGLIRGRKAMTDEENDTEDVTEYSPVEFIRKLREGDENVVEVLDSNTNIPLERTDVENKVDRVGDGGGAVQPQTVKEWTIEILGDEIDCKVNKMHRLGHYCGYASLPDELRDLSERELRDMVRVNGGITYKDEEKVGFDTGHAWDVSLDEDGNRFGYLTEMPEIGFEQEEWTVDDVVKETEALAIQLLSLSEMDEEDWEENNE